MKKQTFRLLTLSLAASLTPSAFSAVTLNGEEFTSVRLLTKENGAIKLITDPVAKVLDEGNNSVDVPLLDSNYQFTVMEDGGKTAITLDFKGIKLEAINCTLEGRTVSHPLHCEEDVTTPPTCSSVDAPDTIPWASIPTKKTIVTGTKGTASVFTTSDSPTYKGYFTALATTSSSHLVRRMWITKCDGSPVVRPYTQYGDPKNGCDVSGSAPKLTWTQELKPSSVTSCKLNPGETYLLNYTQSAFGTGTGPVATSALIRVGAGGGN